MRHFEGDATAHLQGIGDFGIVKFLGRERVVIEIGIGSARWVKAGHAILKVVNLAEGAPE